MKKFTYMAAVALLAVATLTACGTKSNDKTESASNAGETAVVTEAPVATEAPQSTPVVEETTTIEVTHSLGTVTVPINPKKAVIFDFGVLDTAKELGVETELAVAATSLPEYLSDYSNNVSAGSLKEPNLEAIFEFEPEVIIISGRQSAFYDELNEIAPTVFVELDSTKYMEDFEKNTRLVAQIFGKDALVDEKIAKINAKVAEVQALTAANEDKALVLLTNDGNMSAYGPGSRFGIIHDLLGVKAADENIEASTHGMEANYEYVSKTNPDLIFVVDRTEATNAETTTNVSVLDNELVLGTNAGKNDKIVKLDAEIWYKAGGGIYSVEKMISEIADAVK